MKRTKKLTVTEYPVVFSIQEKIRQQVNREDYLFHANDPVPELPKYTPRKVTFKKSAGFINLIKSLKP